MVFSPKEGASLQSQGILRLWTRPKGFLIVLWEPSLSPLLGLFKQNVGCILLEYCRERCDVKTFISQFADAGCFAQSMTAFATAGGTSLVERAGG